MPYYFEIYNQTKKQCVKPAIVKLTFEQSDLDEIIKIMNWKDDFMYVYTSYGDFKFYNGNKDDIIDDDSYEYKYFCNYTKRIMDREYSRDDFEKLRN